MDSSERPANMDASVEQDLIGNEVVDSRPPSQAAGNAVVRQRPRLVTLA
jgi:hypothetical protein